VEDRVLIRFEYLFESSGPAVELIIYLTDVPELLGASDPARAEHYVEVARLRPPPVGRPGSPGSGEFGVFYEYVSPGQLDFVRGTRVELELVGPAGTCVLINNWDPQVHCHTDVCKDVSGNGVVNDVDLLTMLGEYGQPADLVPDPEGDRDLTCLDGIFSQDGYVDLEDVLAWDLLLNNYPELELQNLCDLPEQGIPLTGDQMETTGAGMMSTSYGDPPAAPWPGCTGGSLVLAGKRWLYPEPPLDDRLYVLDGQGQLLAGPYLPIVDPKQDQDEVWRYRGNGRLVRDLNGQLYQLHLEQALVRLEDGEVLVPPRHISGVIEPRYGQPASVSVGLDQSGEKWAGRPILDAVFDPNGTLYVVPVVVDPNGPPYTAAARLELLGGGMYDVDVLYDAPYDPNDNLERDCLREIDIDGTGRVYVLNAHRDNSSDVLWVFDADSGQLLQTRYLPDVAGPVGLCASGGSDLIYVASSQKDPPEPNATSTAVYGLSTADPNLPVARSVPIEGMGHVTEVIEDPFRGDLWVAGFVMRGIPDEVMYPPRQFGYACLAKVPPGSDETVIADEPVCGDLALPMSLAWVGLPPATLVASEPSADGSLPKMQNNLILCTFDRPIALPSSGDPLVIRDMSNGCVDVGASFTYSIDADDPNGTTLEARETDPNDPNDHDVLPEETWYQVDSAPGWTEVAPFQFLVYTLVGDCNSSGRVTTADYSGVKAALGQQGDIRSDLNGSSRVTTADYSVVKANLGRRQPTKPPLCP